MLVLPPSQKAGVTGFTVTTGDVVLVTTETVPVFVHELASVNVTVYIPAPVTVTVAAVFGVLIVPGPDHTILCTVFTDKPTAEFKQVTLPVGAESVKVGNGFTLTELIAILVQLFAAVPVTV
jgi:hypothetical protein